MAVTENPTLNFNLEAVKVHRESNSIQKCESRGDKRLMYASDLSALKLETSGRENESQAYNGDISRHIVRDELISVRQNLLAIPAVIHKVKDSCKLKLRRREYNIFICVKFPANFYFKAKIYFNSRLAYLNI